MVRRARILGALLIAGLAALALHSLQAHVVPMVGLTVAYSIATDEVTCGLNLPPKLLAEVLQEPVDLSQVPTREARLELYRDLEELFRRRNAVLVDGLQVLPVIQTLSITVPEEIDRDQVELRLPERPDSRILLRYGNVPGVWLLLSYPLKTSPREITFTWDIEEAFFEPDPSLPEGEAEDQQLVAMLVDGERRYYVSFAPGDTQYVWRPVGEPGGPVAPVATRPAPTLALPPVTLVVLLLLVLVRPLRRRRSWLVGGLAVAVATCWWRPLEVPHPWPPPPPLPSESRALELFRALHANLYRAFDYLDEQAIYATLSQSVDGPLLEDIYLEVYRSLALQEEGGAICHVQRVDVEELELLPGRPAGPESFAVRCRWGVTGTIAHWGHVHRRLNRYEARYVVARRGDLWKLVECTVLAHRRVVQQVQVQGTGERPADLLPPESER